MRSVAGERGDAAEVRPVREADRPRSRSGADDRTAVELGPVDLDVLRVRVVLVDRLGRDDEIRRVAGRGLAIFVPQVGLALRRDGGRRVAARVLRGAAASAGDEAGDDSEAREDAEGAGSTGRERDERRADELEHGDLLGWTRRGAYGLAG